MQSNSILNKAKYSDNTDEWYTDYNTVEEEVDHYKEQFNNKIVLCNCDDPFESAFAKYFLRKFNTLHLKKLICTSYKGSRIVESSPLVDNKKKKMRSNVAYVMQVTEIGDGTETDVDEETIVQILNSKGVVKRLKGDGDFRSNECLGYLQEADIVVTNPPFSKFIELFNLLMEHKKKFLIIGNQNAITYKEIFPFIKKGEVWIGYRFGDMPFKVPNDTRPRETRYWVDSTGQKWRSIGNAMWLTNMDNERKHLEMKLTAHYMSDNYPKYDNYDAINVSRVANIPLDYYGIMGVPLTYLKYHNEDQFEIVGEANHGSDNEYDLFKPTINKKEIFKRILIRRR